MQNSVDRLEAEGKNALASSTPHGCNALGSCKSHRHHHCCPPVPVKKSRAEAAGLDGIKYSRGVIDQHPVQGQVKSTRALSIISAVEMAQHSV